MQQIENDNEASSNDVTIKPVCSHIQLKEEFIPLKNKIKNLLLSQGEIKSENLEELHVLAELAQIDNLVLDVFIEQITLQHNVCKDLDDLSRKTPSSKAANSQKVEQESSTTYLTILKRPTFLWPIFGLMILITLYIQYQRNEKIKKDNAHHWSQALQTNTIDAYKQYLALVTSKTSGNGVYIAQANLAIAELMQDKENIQSNIHRAQQHLITSAQYQLIKLGYQLSKTGTLDSRTEHAIKDFEQKNKLLMTGNVDNLLLNKLIQVYQQQDDDFWQVTQEKSTINAYLHYKKTFPQGSYLIQADQLIKQLTLEENATEQQKIALQDKLFKQKITRLKEELLNNMVTLPAGQFDMGCDDHNICKNKEAPMHKVIINSFSIMATEVTFELWDACVTGGSCKISPNDEQWGRAERPVIDVNYEDIVNDFIPWINKITNENFSLPSEAQWEYAAKANSASLFSNGETLSCLEAKYGHFSGICGNDRKTSRIKNFKPNAFGLYDMHGNVWEWTQDCWNDNYISAPSDGSAWLTGDCTARVTKGGSWLDEESLLRSTFRRGLNRTTRTNMNGFRLIFSDKTQ